MLFGRLREKNLNWSFSKFKSPNYFTIHFNDITYS